MLKVIGSFCLAVFLTNLHAKFNFTNITNKAESTLLLDSCGTIFISQGISLHYDSNDKTAIYPSLLNRNALIKCVTADIL